MAIFIITKNKLRGLPLFLLRICLLFGGSVAIPIVTSRVTRTVIENLATCNHTIDGVIKIGHPISLQPGSKYFDSSRDALKAIELYFENINTARCGVLLRNGERVKLELSSYDDYGRPEQVQHIVNKMLQGTYEEPDFFLGPYSSELTRIQAQLTQDGRKITVAGGAASTPIFEGNDRTFGTFAPTAQYLTSVVELLSKHGIKTVASFHENLGFTRGVCSALPDLLTNHEMRLIDAIEVEKHPSPEILIPMAQNFSTMEEPPEAVISCVYETGCESWMRAMRIAKWSPNAQVFTVCVGKESFESSVGSDAEYLLGVSPWDKSLTVTDQITGWTAQAFDELFKEYTVTPATYQAASAAASLGVLIQAIEKAEDWRNNDEIAQILSTDTFPTLYGNITFDSNGQNSAPFLTLQYQREKEESESLSLVRLSSEEFKESDFVYPMPTWGQRDCKSGNLCEGNALKNVPSVGVCTRAGTCLCHQEEDYDNISSGSGFAATCFRAPKENYSFISKGTIGFGFFLVGIQSIFFVVVMGWTYYHRKHRIVKASQPIFCVILSMGCFIQVCSILTLGVQGEYRILYDQDTYQPTNRPNPDVTKLDMACMGFYWLYFIGFALTFSALFAKILRVKRMFEHGRAFRRVVIRARDMAIIIVLMVSIMTVLLLILQFVAPFRWSRRALFFDSNDYTIKSVGQCEPEHSWGWALAVPPYLVEIAALCYVLYLCYVMRDVPDHFHDTKWVAVSVVCTIQINLLAIPLLVIARGSNPDIHYFVKALLSFLQGSSVILFIFVPKMWEVHIKRGQRNSGGFTHYQASPYNSSIPNRNIGGQAASLSSLRQNASMRAMVEDGPSPYLRSSLPLNLTTNNKSRKNSVPSKISEEDKKNSGAEKTAEDSTDKHDDVFTI